MEIYPGIKIIDLCLYLEKENILIISDVHIGYEEALHKQGILIPMHSFRDISERISHVLGNKIFSKIIITGDLKHEFGKISEQEWKETLRFLDILSKHTPEIVLLKGNHDKIIGPIAEKRNLKVKDYDIIGKILVCHGDVIFKDEIYTDIDSIIIGHEHPAVSLREGPRVEKYKCFLKGKFKKKTIIVMPSFNGTTEGTDVLKEELLSPYLHQDLSDFEVYIVEENTLYFGKLRKLLSDYT